MKKNCHYVSGTVWTNWMIVGTSGVCLPLLLLVKEQYNRLTVDELHPKVNAQITVPAPPGAYPT
jgi:hypothetical protein